MEDLKQVLEETIICFDCGGDLACKDDFIICNQCSRKYALSGSLLEFDSSEFKSKYGGQFKEGAENYEDAHSLGESFSKAVTRSAKAVLEGFFALPVHSALEIGCGTGIATRGYSYHRIAQYIFATDISREMLNQAVKKGSAGNIVFFVQDAHKLNMRNGSFEIVFGSSILHHLTDLDKCLGEVFRVLKDNGVAISMEPFYYGYQFMVFLTNMVFEYLELQRKYPKKHMQAFKKYVDSYAYNIRFRYENRNLPHVLEGLDDKHLFVEDELVPLAHEIGFRKVMFFCPWHVDPQTPPGAEGLWRKIIIELVDALIKEAGLEGRLKLDYSAIPFLQTFDDLIGNALLDFISPQEIIVFQK